MLGLHIFDEKLLESIETRLKSFPGSVSQGLFAIIAGPIFRAMVKRQQRNWLGGPIKWVTEFQKYLNIKLVTEDGKIYPMKWSSLRKDPFALLFAESMFMSFFIFGILWIIISPLLLPVIVTIFIFSKTQKLLRLKSIFGLLGAVFLVVGFILQFFS